MDRIAALQNADGGWPYERGRTSWTEPTALVLLSGLNGAIGEAPFGRGVEWLRSSQNPDGGWSPQPKAGPSTWVTALAALLPDRALGSTAHAKAIGWILRETGEESNMVNRVRQWMLGNQDLSFGSDEGWPWYPGAAAWVMPTAISLIALRKENRIRPSEALKQRIDGGIRYLLSHTCKDGGWNHGSTHALGYESSAYPETTGVALLALRGVKAPQVDGGVALAEKFMEQPEPAGLAWLRLGLLAQGRHVAALSQEIVERHTDVADEAVLRISEAPEVLFA